MKILNIFIIFWLFIKILNIFIIFRLFIKIINISILFQSERYPFHHKNIWEDHNFPHLFRAGDCLRLANLMWTLYAEPSCEQACTAFGRAWSQYGVGEAHERLEQECSGTSHAARVRDLKSPSIFRPKGVNEHEHEHECERSSKSEASDPRFAVRWARLSSYTSRLHFL